VRAGRGALRHDHARRFFRTVNLSHPSQEVSCTKIKLKLPQGVARGGPARRQAQSEEDECIPSMAGNAHVPGQPKLACLPFHRAVSFHRSLFPLQVVHVRIVVMSTVAVHVSSSE
jgi:hypothetical protein